MKIRQKTLTLVFMTYFLLSFLSCSKAENGNKKRESAAVPADYVGPTALATFAGGCFWCVEAPFEGIDGILSVTSGYAGGKEKNPSYDQVASGKTSHRESVQIAYNPDIISFSELLDLFWQQFDPTDEGGSFFDRGFQYTSAVFYHDKLQKDAAEASIRRLGKSGIFDKPIVTPVVKFSNFYAAEDYHQDYYSKNPTEYYAYRKGSGRDAFIAKHWPGELQDRYVRPSEAQIKALLSPLQYAVAMQSETETAFTNAYNGNKEAGLYVCIVSGAPLFSSSDKYESNSGWPSFTKPLDARLISKPTDSSYGMVRVEIRSKLGDSHLGHSFNDGPEPTKLRYCMNSAAMRFVAKKDMEKEGYGAWLWAVD